MITVERCECSDGFVNGAAIFHNHDVAEVQACNMCQRFACDEDACEAYVAALNRELGELHFVRVQANVGRDEHGTRFVPSIGLRARRARREGLSHDELAAELSRLGIKTGEGERATESASVVLFRSRGDGFEAIADVSVEIDGDELKSDDGDNIRTYTKCAGDIRLWDRRGFQGWKRLNKFDEEVFVFTECQ
jgi:ribosome-binding protein aMBF1 (putative translation factor)